MNPTAAKLDTRCLKHTAVDCRVFNIEPWICDLDVLATSVTVCLGVSVLCRFDPRSGDLSSTSVRYAIDLGNSETGYMLGVLSCFDGFSTSGYERIHRIELPEQRSDWKLRVRRLSPPATIEVANWFHVASLTEWSRSTFELVNSDMLDSIKRNMTDARAIVAGERTCLSCGACTVNGVLPCGH